MLHLLHIEFLLSSFDARRCLHVNALNKLVKNTFDYSDYKLMNCLTNVFQICYVSWTLFWTKGKYQFFCMKVFYYACSNYVGQVKVISGSCETNFEVKRYNSLKSRGASINCEYSNPQILITRKSRINCNCLVVAMQQLCKSFVVALQQLYYNFVAALQFRKVCTLSVSISIDTRYESDFQHWPPYCFDWTP